MRRIFIYEACAGILDLWDKFTRCIDRALWLDNYSVRLYDRLLRDCKRSKCKPYEIADELEKLGKEYREFANVGSELADTLKALKKRDEGGKRRKNGR